MFLELKEKEKAFETSINTRFKSKKRKYNSAAEKKQLIEDRKISMIPLIFTAGGVVHKDTDNLLKKIDRYAAKHFKEKYWRNTLLTQIACSMIKTSYRAERVCISRRANKIGAGIFDVLAGGARAR